MRGEGAGLRRSPQGHAAGHRHSDPGNAITEDLGIKLENVQVGDLGQATKIAVAKDNTIIVEGKASMRRLRKQLNEIRSQVDKTTSDCYREKLRARLDEATALYSVQ